MDLFISHASEDKDLLVRPLAARLRSLGYEVWYDEFTLRLGDSLRRSIDKGLSQARYGCVVLSESFFAKQWPQYELDGLVARENGSGSKVILPVWHNVTRDRVAEFSPTLADRVAVLSSRGLDVITDRLCEVLGPVAAQVKASAPATEWTSQVGPDLLCPNCGQKGEEFGYEGGDGDEFHWFECGGCGHFEPIP